MYLLDNNPQKSKIILVKKEVLFFMFKKFFSSIVSFSLAGVLFLAVAPKAVNAIAPTTNYIIDDGVTVDGGFTTYGYNNPTTIDEIYIEDYYYESYTDTLNPGWAYTLVFQVTDYDGIDTLSFIPKIYYNTLKDVDDTEEEAIAKDKQAFDNLLGVNLDGNGFVLEEFSVENYYDELPYNIRKGNITDDSQSTWELYGVNQYVSYDNYTLTVEISFVPSKVAAYDYDGNWAVGVKVIDNLKTPKDTYFASYTGINMSWYGEIWVDENADLNFGEVSVDSTYSDNNASILNVKFVSNGGFSQLASVDSYWVSDVYEPGTGYWLYANLDDSGLVDDAQEFAIIVDYEDTLDAVNGIKVSSYYDEVQYRSTKTTESGVLFDYYFWLNTNPNFQNANYYGDVYLAIGNNLYD